MIDIPESLRSSLVYLDNPDDFDAIILHRIFMGSEPERLTCRPISDFSEKEIILRYRGRKNEVNLRDFVIRRTGDNCLLGRITYFDLNPRNRSAEIGFLIAPEYRRKGYASEALRLLLRHLFEELGINKVMAQTGEYNEASIALLKKLGFKQDGRLRQHHEIDGKLYDDLLFSILAEEFNP